MNILPQTPQQWLELDIKTIPGYLDAGQVAQVIVQNRLMHLCTRIRRDIEFNQDDALANIYNGVTQWQNFLGK